MKPDDTLLNDSENWILANLFLLKFKRNANMFTSLEICILEFKMRLNKFSGVKTTYF